MGAAVKDYSQYTFTSKVMLLERHLYNKYKFVRDEDYAFTHFLERVYVVCHRNNEKIVHKAFERYAINIGDFFTYL